jgi:hypothetical protein
LQQLFGLVPGASSGQHELIDHYLFAQRVHGGQKTTFLRHRSMNDGARNNILPAIESLNGPLPGSGSRNGVRHTYVERRTFTRACERQKDQNILLSVDETPDGHRRWADGTKLILFESKQTYSLVGRTAVDGYKWIPTSSFVTTNIFHRCAGFD